MINNNIAHSETAHKYLLKVFYNKINKKRYNIQIWQYNICHTNVIAIKNIIKAAKKGRKTQKPSVKKVNRAVIVKNAKLLRVINISNKYKWVISNTNIDIARNLKLNSIKKY